MEQNVCLPVKASIVGEVVRIEYLTMDDHDATVITVQDKAGVNSKIWFAPKFIESAQLNTIMFVKNIISADVEYCIAGVTEFETEDGDYDFHTKDHVRGIDASNASDMVLTIMGFSQSFIDRIAEMRSVRASSTEHRKFVVKPEIDDYSLSIEQLKASIVRLEAAFSMSTSLVKPSIRARIIALQEIIDKRLGETNEATN